METTPTTIRLDNDLKRKLNKELKSLSVAGQGLFISTEIG